MLIAEYFHRLEAIVFACSAIISREISFEERTHHIGLIKGIITFIDGSELHFKEFVDVRDKTVKYKYAYHYQKDDRLIFRYDNHPMPLKDIPQHHKHHLDEKNIIETDIPDLEDVLNEVVTLLPT